MNMSKEKLSQFYWWDIQAYKDNPTEEELQKLVWLMYLEGVHDGSTKDYDI